MIGENIDESKTSLDATQKPNINSDLGVKREIVGISDLVQDKNNAIESNVIGIEQVEDDGDNIPTTGNCDRSSLQTIEEDEERKDNPLHTDDDGENIPTTGNCDRSSLQTVEEVEERKDNPLRSDDDGDNIPNTGNHDRSSLQTVEEDEERKDNPLCTDDDGDNIPTTGNRDRSPLQTVEEVEERKDHPLCTVMMMVINHHCKQLKKLQRKQMILCTIMMQVTLGMTRAPPPNLWKLK